MLAFVFLLPPFLSVCVCVCVCVCVLQYDAAVKADSEEGAKSGHGTFLAGVIAGASNPSKAFGQCGDSKHQEARGAGRSKIAFYDVGAGKNNALATP